jgi:hypothetical protein
MGNSVSPVQLPVDGAGVRFRNREFLGWLHPLGRVRAQRGAGRMPTLLWAAHQNRLKLALFCTLQIYFGRSVGDGIGDIWNWGQVKSEWGSRTTTNGENGWERGNATKEFGDRYW